MGISERYSESKSTFCNSVISLDRGRTKN